MSSTPNSGPDCLPLVELRWGGTAQWWSSLLCLRLSLSHAHTHTHTQIGSGFSLAEDTWEEGLPTSRLVLLMSMLLRSVGLYQAHLRVGCAPGTRGFSQSQIPNLPPHNLKHTCARAHEVTPETSLPSSQAAKEPRAAGQKRGSQGLPFWKQAPL